MKTDIRNNSISATFAAGVWDLTDIDQLKKFAPGYEFDPLKGKNGTVYKYFETDEVPECSICGAPMLRKKKFQKSIKDIPYGRFSREWRVTQHYFHCRCVKKQVMYVH